MEQRWFTAKEIAGALGITDRVVRIKAKEWTGDRKRQGSKAKEYPLTGLPQEVQQKLVEAGLVKVEQPAPAPQPVREHHPQPVRAASDKHLQQIDAWTEIIREHAVYRHEVCRPAGTQMISCDYAFCEAYNRGEVCSEGTRNLVRTISRPTLLRQVKKLRDGGTISLADSRGKHMTGRGKLDQNEEARALVTAMLLEFPHTPIARIHEVLAVHCPGFEIHASTLSRWVERWVEENRESYTALTNPDKWKSGYMVAVGSQSEDVVRPNQRWELDSTPGDVLLSDGRYSLIGCVDVFSRRAMVHLSKTSSAVAIAALLRKAILAWGVPESIKTDNGKDYTSGQIQRICADLQMGHELCPPFQPWKKPHVERFFKTLNHGVFPLLEGYIGSNVAERQVIRDRQAFSDRLFKKGDTVEIRMEATEFQQICDDWVSAVYDHREHRGLNGQTPHAVWHSERWTFRTIENSRVLDILLAEAPRGFRTVQKDGIHLENCVYIAAELGAWVRRKVHLRYDPLDIGKLWVFSPEGEFICVAEDRTLPSVDRASVAESISLGQKEFVKAGTKRLKREAKTQVDVRKAAQHLVEFRKEQAEKVLAFPQVTVPHQAPGVAEAGRAAAFSNERPLTEAEKEQQRRDYERGLQKFYDDQAAANEGKQPQPTFQETQEMQLREGFMAFAEGRLTPDGERWLYRMYRQRETVYMAVLNAMRGYLGGMYDTIYEHFVEMWEVELEQEHKKAQ